MDGADMTGIPANFHDRPKYFTDRTQPFFGSPSPLHLKFLSHKTVLFDMRIISAIFQGKVITVGFGSDCRKIKNPGFSAP